MQPAITLLCLFSEAVPNILLTMKELGLVSATDHKGLRRGQDLEAWKGKMRVGNKVISYLANRGDDIAQRAQRGGHGANRGPNLHVDTSPFPLLLKLALEEVDPPLSIGALLASQVLLRMEPLYGLEQIVSLLP